MHDRGKFDLEERTFAFGRAVRRLLRKLPPTPTDADDRDQLLRASGSVGANYIEANEALSKRDFLMRIKICRKESKESRYWLRMLDIDDAELDAERGRLTAEAHELLLIFAAIVRRMENARAVD